MDNYRRKGRRGGGHSFANLPSTSQDLIPPPQECKPWSFLSGLYSCLIMACLIALIYMMLDFHCTSCKARYDMKNLTDSIENIAVNLSALRSSSKDIETWISNLPKFDKEMKILKELPNLERKDLAWPKTKVTLPNVDVYLTHGAGDKLNCSKLSKLPMSAKCAKQLPLPIPVA